jgi:nitrogen fixation/metabolism regulation signal transduction histidine kinase
MIKELPYKLLEARQESITAGAYIVHHSKATWSPLIKAIHDSKDWSDATYGKMNAARVWALTFITLAVLIVVLPAIFLGIYFSNNPYSPVCVAKDKPE